ARHVPRAAASRVHSSCSLTLGHAARRAGLEVVPKGGIEPPHPPGYTIFGGARLPVPPLRRAPMIRQPTLVYCGALPKPRRDQHDSFTRRCFMADRAGAVNFKANPITHGAPDTQRA